MPELPEVEARVRYLKATSLHKVIVGTRVTDNRVVKDMTVGEFRRRLKGRSFREVRRRGKFILLKLDCGDFLILHLGMTGDVKYYRKREPSYARIIFAFRNGFNTAYISRRMLQGTWLKSSPEDLPAIRNMGPEPLDPEFSLSGFAERFVGRRGNLKSLLMDQSFIAGIGNIYADEILFQCGISPARTVEGLKASQVEQLYKEMRRTLTDVCRVNADWNRLDGTYLAPRRSPGGLCPRCGRGLLRLKIGGRSSYFCSRCQR